MNNINELTKELAGWVMESEAEDFNDWLEDGNGEPVYGVDDEEWAAKLEEFMDGCTPEVWDWLATNTKGHIYSVAWKLNKEMNK